MHLTDEEVARAPLLVQAYLAQVERERRTAQAEPDKDKDTDTHTAARVSSGPPPDTVEARTPMIPTRDTTPDEHIKVLSDSLHEIQNVVRRQPSFARDPSAHAVGRTDSPLERSSSRPGTPGSLASLPVRTRTGLTDENVALLDTAAGTATASGMPTAAPSMTGPPSALPPPATYDDATLEQLVTYGNTHWPDKHFDQFRVGVALDWPMFQQLVQLCVPTDESDKSDKSDKSGLYIVTTSSPRQWHEYRGCRGIVVPHYINKEPDRHPTTVPRPEHETKAESPCRHFAISFLDLATAHPTYTSWGLDNHTHREMRAACELAFPDLGLGFQRALPDYADNMSAFRCLEVLQRSLDQPAPTEGLSNTEARAYVLHKMLVSLPVGTPGVPTIPTVSSSSNKRPRTDDGTDASNPPLKKKEDAPAVDELAKELVSERAIGWFRRHIRNCKNDPSDADWRAGGNVGDRVSELLSLADTLATQTTYHKLVSMILRTHAVRILASKTRAQDRLDASAPVAKFSKRVVDALYPDLRASKTSETAYRRWLTLQRKLERMSDFLPVLPHGSSGGGPFTFRHYERQSNDKIQELLHLLANNDMGRRIARAGRAFRHHVLFRHNQVYRWETMTNTELDQLSDREFIALIPKIKTREAGVAADADDSDDSDSDSDDDVEDVRDLEAEHIEMLQSQPLTHVAVGPARPLSHGTGASDEWERVSTQTAFDFDLGTHDGLLRAPDALTDLHLPLGGASSFDADLDLDLDLDWAMVDHTPYGDFLRPAPPLLVRGVLADDDMAITFALRGNVAELSELFARGRADPSSTSYTRRFSLLRWALYGGMHNYAMVKFLLARGAPIDDEAYHNAWDFRMREKCTPTELSELRCVTEQRHGSWFEDQAFPEIHRIVFGLVPRDLAQYVAAHPSTVHELDGLGRTALDWAVARKQLLDIRVLLAAQAGVDTVDHAGRTILIHAIDSNSHEALRMVLEAGADPNVRVPSQFHRSSAVASASMTREHAPAMVRMLVQHGAHIDQVTPEGQTALQRAALLDNVECARVLVENGAQMHGVPGMHASPFQTAILHKCHDVLQFFIDQSGPAQSLQRDATLDHYRDYIMEHGNADTIDLYHCNHS